MNKNPPFYFLMAICTVTIMSIASPVRALDSDIYGYTTETLIIKLRSDPDGSVRRRAAEMLGIRKAIVGVPALIEALNDTESLVRSEAATALGKINDPRAVEPLIKALQEEMSISSIIQALGMLKDPRAVRPLIGILRHDFHLVEIARALQAIGPMGTKGLVDEMESVGSNWESLERKRNAARALGIIEDPSTIDPLIRALGDSDWSVRSYAAEALGNIKSSKATEPLIAMLKDNAVGVEMSAASALGKIGDKRAVEPLLLALSKQPRHGRQREYIMIALGTLKDIRAVEPLIKMLKDTNSYDRSVAAESLSRIGGSRAGEVLMHGLYECDTDIIYGAIDYFIAQGKPKTEGLLINGLKALEQKKQSSAPVAEAFEASKNSILMQAAKDWEKRNNKKLPQYYRNKPQWGEGIK